MYVFPENDRYYIENKYHWADDKNFNPFNRMNYHGCEYDTSTGFDDDEMQEELVRLTSEPGFYDLPHPVAKAKVFAFLLDHARIDVNEHDWFAGFYNWGRKISEFTCSLWHKEVFSRIPQVKEKTDKFNKTGTVAIWPDFDHVIPYWDDILDLGFTGLLERTKQYHNEHIKKGISPETEAFFQGIEISYSAILRILRRYADYAGNKSNGKSKLQTECFHHLCDGAPQNTYEALQTMYLFFMFCECVDHYQTRSLGNGFDSTLYRFWKNDIKNGTFTEKQLDDFIAYFLMQYSAIGNYWGHPMYIGGTNSDGSTKYSELSMRILEIYEALHIYNPKIQVKVNTNTPKKYLYKIFEMIRNGISSFVFCCEPGMQRAMMTYGVTADEALNYEISGCYETRVLGNESSSTVGYINALKAVELALHDGKDTISGEQVGIHTGSPENFKSFEDFYFAFLKQWENMIEETISIGNSYESYLAEINPSNLYSATIKRALEKGVDGYAFGVKYSNSAMLNCGFASAVDAVMAVKNLCFDEKFVTLKKLVEILDNNWEENDRLRAKVLSLPQKYGNANPQADKYATAMAAYFANHINNRPNARGGVYKAVMHSAMEFVWQGQLTAATPDGRKKGDEESKNGSPVIGMDREGVTALIRSATALAPYTYPESFCVDILLHPSAVQGDEGLTAMYALVMTYLKNGGQSIQFNIFNSEMLRDAQKHPEKYKNLQVRVCGWNVLWNNLSKKEQDAYIKRAESIK